MNWNRPKYGSSSDAFKLNHSGELEPVFIPNPVNIQLEMYKALDLMDRKQTIHNSAECAKKYLNSVYGIQAFNLPARYLCITKVIFNGPATIVYWYDGTKTVVKCKEGEAYSKETGLAMAFCKRALGGGAELRRMFKTWCGED